MELGTLLHPIHVVHRKSSIARRHYSIQGDAGMIIDPNMTIVEFKMLMDIDGSHQSYGYLIHNPECCFADFQFGYQSLTQLVDEGLEPSCIINKLIEWYPEIESCVRTYGVLLNGEHIDPT